MRSYGVFLRDTYSLILTKCFLLLRCQAAVNPHCVNAVTVLLSEN